MFNVYGVVRIKDLKKISEKLVVGTVYSTRKVGEEFQTTFFDCKIVSDAITQLRKDEVKEKDLIEIQSGLISKETREYQGKKYEKNIITIFKAEKVDLTQNTNKKSIF